MIGYRRDIDGLRALAIVPVVLFHAGVPAFSGGFIGVDIFFVISGFLITNQLLKTEARGWRRIFDFYERRVRRIAPALIVMLATVLFSVTILLPAVDVLRTAKSAVAAIFFAANYRFYGKSGYFDGAAEDEVLLHTWSLAIEEQFYLFFPLLLFLVKPRSLPLVLIAFAAGSLLVAQLSLGRDPAWAFYLLPARAWELLAGALLAASNMRGGLSGPLREAVAAFGCLLVVGSIATYDSFTPIPGVSALPPVLGAVILLAVGEGSFVGRILSSAPLVWIGLISYSLYLWHWPILVISRQLFGSADGVMTAALIALSFLVAVLSVRYVERPFRNRAAVGWRRLFAVVGIAALIVAASSAALIASNGWPQRSPQAEQYFHAASRIEAAFQNNPCLSHGRDLPPLEACILGAKGLPVTGVLWGDSHAAHWAPMINSAGLDLGLGFRQMTKAGCPPIPVEKMFPADSSRLQCPAFNSRVQEHILANADLRYVVLSANWQGITEGVIRVGSAGSVGTIDNSRTTAQRALEQLTISLTRHGKTVIIIGQTPIPHQNVILCKTRRRHLGLDDVVCDSFPSDRARVRDQAAQRLFAGSVIKADAKTLSPLRLFCDDLSCITSEDGVPLYIDAAHLSPSGARKLETDFAKALGKGTMQDRAIEKGKVFK